MTEWIVTLGSGGRDRLRRPERQRPKDARSASLPTGHLHPQRQPALAAPVRVTLPRAPALLRGYQLACSPPPHPVLLTGLTHVRETSPFEFLLTVYSSWLAAVAVTEYSVLLPVAALR